MRGAAWKLKMKARHVGEGLTEGANTGDMGDAGIGGTDHAGPFIVEPIDNDIVQGHPQSRIGKGDSQGVVNAPLQVAHLPKHGFRTGLVIPPFDPNGDPDAAPPKSKGGPVGGDDTGEAPASVYLYEPPLCPSNYSTSYRRQAAPKKGPCGTSVFGYSHQHHPSTHGQIGVTVGALKRWASPEGGEGEERWSMVITPRVGGGASLINHLEVVAVSKASEVGWVCGRGKHRSGRFYGF
ncbi:hypothetical protein PLEOSDRAFT_1086750 [Pleurotus ostreatus PC15]|uniref:Uncharacterized protein n=1 Tax=Pleurotus ostreatus (strain PC15) TaxID=1137138 RepID=A0A067NH43_PLEO1|nr:hypothetical protein PLEOSDRAFT_1086750 [Pleurotus ostreatus PC15]